MRGNFQGIGLGSLFPRRAEYPHNLVAAGEKGIEYRLAKILLANYRDFHVSSERVNR